MIFKRWGETGNILVQDEVLHLSPFEGKPTLPVVMGNPSSKFQTSPFPENQKAVQQSEIYLTK